MFRPRHFLRMARWAHRPPPMWRVKLVVGVVLLALLIAGIERFIGWPDMLTVEPHPRPQLPPPAPSGD